MNITKTTHSKLASTNFDNLSFGKSFSDHMFTVNFKDGQWTNAEIVPYGPISVHPSTHVFHYGQAIFEGMKAYKNKEGKTLLFRPLDNLKRFNASAQRLCMPTISEDLFMTGLTELLKLDNKWIPQADNKSLYVRPFMIADSEFIRATPSSSYRFMIITSPTASYYKGETKLKIEEKYARSFEGGTGYAKAAGNYAAAFAPTKHAQNNGYTQVIWTDALKHEYIEESGTMNIMFRINDTLVTPKLSESILGGITRDSVIAIARQKGIQVEERKISVTEIIEAYKNNSLKEAFGTGTAVTLNPIDKITFRDFDMSIAKQTEDSFGQMLKSELLNIQYGKIQDTFGWTIEL